MRRAPCAIATTHIGERCSQRRAETSYQVIRRSGELSPFDASKIAVALTKAFLAVEGEQRSGVPARA
ncbi:MAG: hypothetical protein MZV49_07470 [Rhodopseudomonas palustris]|nr:hypothetical protein [Rhodopseudomonas palustris]